MGSRWTRSSFCGTSSCLEVTADFHTATASGNGDCVAVAKSSSCIAVRDSKDPDGPILHFTHDEWRSFLVGARAGEFDVSGEGGGN